MPLTSPLRWHPNEGRGSFTAPSLYILKFHNGGMMKKDYNITNRGDLSKYIQGVGKSICDRNPKTTYAKGGSSPSLTTAIMDYLAEKNDDLPYVILGPRQRNEAYAKGRQAIPFLEYFYFCMGGKNNRRRRKSELVSFKDFMAFPKNIKNNTYKFSGMLPIYIATAMRRDMNYCTSYGNGKNSYIYSSPLNTDDMFFDPEKDAGYWASVKQMAEQDRPHNIHVAQEQAAKKAEFDKGELLLDTLETNNGYDHSSPTMVIEVQGIRAIVPENVTIRVDLNEDGSPSSLEFRAS